MGQAAMYLSVEGQRQPRVSKKWAQHPLPLQLCGELAIFYCAQDDASPDPFPYTISFAVDRLILHTMAVCQ